MVTLEEPAQKKGSRRSRRAVIGLLAVVGVLGLAVATGTLRAHQSTGPAPTDQPTAPAGQATIQVTIDRTAARQVATLATGATHGQYSLDPWGKPAAISRGEALLSESTRYQAQHIYGFGALNPEPRRGHFDWASLDRRVALMRSMGAAPVITLCCAPDWMTSLGTPTSTYPQLPPSPEHIADFAQLARDVALRYRDVKHFQVWNELKGYWDPNRQNWDYAAYTDLYNAVYDALKGVDPTIQVGGPYLVIEGSGDPLSDRNMAVIGYWLGHAHGADFISLSHRIVPWDDPTTPANDQVLQSTDQFGLIQRQIRQKTSLPIWWSEDYADAKPARLNNADHNYQAVALASMLYHEEMDGAAASFRFQPQGVAGRPYEGDQESLFSDTRHDNGGKPFPANDAYRFFNQEFPPGTPLYGATSSSPDVEVLASKTDTLLINKRPVPVAVDLDGRTVTLGRYEVHLFTPG